MASEDMSNAGINARKETGTFSFFVPKSVTLLFKHLKSRETSSDAVPTPRLHSKKGKRLDCKREPVDGSQDCSILKIGGGFSATSFPSGIKWSVASHTGSVFPNCRYMRTSIILSSEEEGFGKK